jgi:hypothetical protein
VAGVGLRPRRARTGSGQFKAVVRHRPADRPSGVSDDDGTDEGQAPGESSGASPEDPEGSPDASFDAVEEVLRGGFFDGMYRRLQAQFPDLPPQAIEDALFSAAEKCARQPRPPDNVRAWLFAVAKNALIDELRRRPTKPFDPDNPEHDRASTRSAEDEVVDADEADRAFASYQRVVDHVKKWPSAKTRTVVLLVLTAAHEGIPLSNAELASSASALLDEDITANAAGVLKFRGLHRLRDEYSEIFPDDRPGASA